MTEPKIVPDRALRSEVTHTRLQKSTGDRPILDLKQLENDFGAKLVGRKGAIPGDIDLPQPSDHSRSQTYLNRRNVR